MAFPLAAETVFWLNLLPVREALAFVPAMLGERLAWSALLTLLVVLGGRSARRYQFAAVGVLALGLLWQTVTDQLLLLHAEALGMESNLPDLRAEGFWGQLWDYVAKGPREFMEWPPWLKWMPVLALGVGGWLVVGYRYLTPGWRATRLMVEGIVLAALVAGHVGIALLAESEQWGNRDAERRLELKAALKKLPLNAAAEGLELRFQRGTYFGTNGLRGDPWRFDFGDGLTNAVLVRMEWETARPPAGMLAFVQPQNLHAASRANPPPAHQPPGFIRRRAMIHPVTTGSNAWASGLPEVLGYRVVTRPDPSREVLALHPAVAKELIGRFQPTLAVSAIFLLEAKTVGVVPVNPATSFQIGEMWLRISRHASERSPLPQMWVSSREPVRRIPGDEFSHEAHSSPDVFLVRNARTREAFVLPWDDLHDLHSINSWVAPLLSPARRASFCAWNPETSLTARAAQFGFDAAWLSEAELVCVRLTLVGMSQRTVRLENFRLEPAAP